MTKEIMGYKEYLEKLFQGDTCIDRYGIPFETKRNKYFFDAGTGKVLRCSEALYRLLLHLFEHCGKLAEEDLSLSEDELSEAMRELREDIQDENIFKARRLDDFNCSHVKNFDGMIAMGCRQLILEVTEQCNLRCKYCVYEEDTQNFRGFSNRYMPVDTAKKAIDFFADASSKEKEIYLTFYGGEPLLGFPLIREATEYFKKKLGGRGTFGITSNLTLMTEEMAEFFAENRFSFTCSLDGTEEIHNQNRVYANGKGSFADTMRGLKLLYEAYAPEDRKLIGINAVIDQPYTKKKFEAMEQFFQELPYVPNKFIIGTNYIGKDERADDPKLFTNIQFMEIIQGRDHIDMDDLEYRKRLEGDEPILFKMTDRVLADIHRRRLSDVPFVDSGLNACCFPGIRRLYVTVDGEFHTCERIGDSPSIGNVSDGLDIERLRKYYIDEYTEKSKENCGNCWAFQLCGVCYARCYDENGLDMNRKRILCEDSRHTNYRALIEYHTILEEHPELLEKYNDKKYEYE